MDLRQLEVFCKVFDLGSFSRAAADLSIAQPTVSGHIKQLEEELGCRLFDRLGKRIAPTPAANLLSPYARRVLATLRDARQAIDQLLGFARGKLLIGGSTIPGEYLLPAMLGEFKERYPDILVTLRIDDSLRIVEAVGERDIELGVVGARLGNAKIDYVPYLKDEMALVVPTTHPFAKKRRITLDQALAESFIFRERGSGSRQSFELLLRHHGVDVKAVRVIAEMGSTEAVVQGIKAGVGISILSRRAVADDVRDGRLKAVNVNGWNLVRNFYIVTRRGHKLSPICDVFYHFLLEQRDRLEGNS